MGPIYRIVQKSIKSLLLDGGCVAIPYKQIFIKQNYTKLNFYNFFLELIKTQKQKVLDEMLQYPSNVRRCMINKSTMYRLELKELKGYSFNFD